MRTFNKSTLATLIAAMALGLASSAVLAKDGDSGSGKNRGGSSSSSSSSCTQNSGSDWTSATPEVRSA